MKSVQQAEAAVAAAQQKIQEAGARRDKQARAVKDFERQMEAVTGETSPADVAALAASLNAARTILVACDRESRDARDERESASKELQQVRDVVAEYGRKIAQSEANIRALNRDMADAQQRIKVINGGLDAERRAIEVATLARAALIMDAARA